MTDAFRVFRARVVKSGESLHDSFRVDNIYYSDRYVARRSAPGASRDAQRERPKLQAGGPLGHEFGDLRV